MQVISPLMPWRQEPLLVYHYFIQPASKDDLIYANVNVLILVMAQGNVNNTNILQATET